MKKIVFLTGSGISAESGIPTFRVSADGLWENYNVKEVCTAGCLDVNEDAVHRFYNMLRDKYGNCKPNKAHELIAELEKDFDITVITQNVDDLHEQAGSTKVLHLHGELKKVRAIDDPSLIWDVPEGGTSPDTMIDGHLVRPHVVFFGEDVPNITKAMDIVKEADICVIVGTSMVVYPAAGLVQYVPYGNKIYYIDPNPAYTPEYPDIITIEKTATEGMKELYESLRN